MKFYVVIGLGRFGSHLATHLYEYGADVLVIDQKEALINSFANRVTRAAVGNARDKDVLLGLGVADCDCAVVAIGSDLAASVLITMNLKALNVPHVICKAHDETHREILEKLGADQVIIPEHEIAEKIAGSLAAPNILEYIELSEEYAIIDVKPPRSWVGKTLRESNVREEYGVTVIAVREGEQTRISPSPLYRITPDATLVMLGEYGALNRIQSLK